MKDLMDNTRIILILKKHNEEPNLILVNETRATLISLLFNERFGSNFDQTYYT